MSLDTIRVTADAIYLIVGDTKSGLGITFSCGRKDEFAAIMVIYENDVAHVYYPGDSDWLSILDVVVAHTSIEQVLQTATSVMKYAVGKKQVQASDFVYISSLLQPYVAHREIYWTVLWWMVWFYYACIAEENYISSSGIPTQLGGLVKIAALLEHGYEGWSVRDACDHYKAGYFYEIYGGNGSIVLAVKQKCAQYGIVRDER